MSHLHLKKCSGFVTASSPSPRNVSAFAANTRKYTGSPLPIMRHIWTEPIRKCYSTSSAWQQFPSDVTSSHRYIDTSLRGSPAGVAMKTIQTTGSLSHTFHLVLAFILGGLFFSTALSIVTAFFALGKENILRAWDMVKIVCGRVWAIFTLGLKTARDTLLHFDDENKRQYKWREAWKVLKEQLTLTKQAAVEGVQAIKLEASLYSAAIGQPGLIAVQYFVDSLSPKLLAAIAKENFVNALNDIQNPNVRKIQLDNFDFGKTGPTLVAARSYRLDDAMALDIDIEWDSDIFAKVKVTTKRIGVVVPVSIKNFRFNGVVRVVLTPLTEEPPGFGAALVSFPKAPNIGLDVSLSSVEITRQPWLRAELLKEIQETVTKEFLWPRRIVVPSGISPVNPKPLLSRVKLDELRSTDPLLVAQKKIDENELIQKTKLKRDIAEEKELELDVYVGEGDRKTYIGSDESIEVDKSIPQKEAVGRNNDSNMNKSRWKFPWRKSPQAKISST
jgi:hypothetical protein